MFYKLSSGTAKFFILAITGGIISYPLLCIIWGLCSWVLSKLLSMMSVLFDVAFQISTGFFYMILVLFAAFVGYALLCGVYVLGVWLVSSDEFYGLMSKMFSGMTQFRDYLHERVWFSRPPRVVQQGSENCCASV